MVARRNLLFACIAVVAMVGCEPKKAAMPDARFAVGSVPYYAPSGLTEAPSCIVEFDRGAENGRPLAAPGNFTGHCTNGNTYTFEAVRVDHVKVIQSASHDGLGSLELDHAHPEWSISLTALPEDAAGKPLEHGANPGYAVWTSGAGCEKVLTLKTNVGESGNEPADVIEAKALAAGTCEIAVEYLGARNSVKITVR